MDRSQLPYRPGVGIMLVNDNNQVFVGKRIDSKSDAWQMPQGGIDDGETPREAAFRELHEEVGTRNAEIIAESNEWFYYDVPDYLIPKLWNGKYRGQSQKWFLLKFKGTNEEIDITAKDPEFSEWKWVDFSVLPDIIVPFKKELYIEVIKEFYNIIINKNTQY